MRRLLLSLIIIGLNGFHASSQTVVGGYNVELRPGLNLVGLHITTPDGNTIESLFAPSPVPEGTVIYKLVSGSLTTNLFTNGRWSQPNDRIEAGDGVLILNPAPQAVVFGFGGELRQGHLTNSIPPGLSIQASISPKAGKLTGDLGLRLTPFDNVYLLTNGEFTVFTFLPNGTWKPSEPVLRLGEAFVVNASQSTNWVTQTGP